MVRCVEASGLQMQMVRCGLVVAGEVADFSMVLGSYGQAYFAAETTEIISGEPGCLVVSVR
jgi:phosphatidate phosphatase PAH1